MEFPCCCGQERPSHGPARGGRNAGPQLSIPRISNDDGQLGDPDADADPGAAAEGSEFEWQPSGSPRPDASSVPLRMEDLVGAYSSPSGVPGDDAIGISPGADGPRALGFMRRGMSNFSVGSRHSKESGRSDATSKSHRSSDSMFSRLARQKWAMAIETSNSGSRPPMEVKRDERLVVLRSDAPPAVEPAGANSGRHPNQIVNTKFTALTWLPKSLWWQFQRLANVYFLAIAVLVLFPFTVKDPKSKIAPFLLVLTWSALKDMYDDMHRRWDDIVVNSQRCMRFKRQAPGDGQSASSTRFEEVAWRDVRVGDVLYVPESAPFPADLLLLHPAGGDDAYISTVMLDGESNLKYRRAPAICEVIAEQCSREGGQDWEDAQTVRAREDALFPWQKLETELARLVDHATKSQLAVKFADPTATLSDVRGAVHPHSSADEAMKCPFGEGCFLPRGCVLRNTPWVLGVALYIGGETKTCLNGERRGAKLSNMQANLNNCVKGLLATLLAICTYATVAAVTVGGSDEPPHVMFFKFCITYYHVVPMSLYVMYEMLKLILGYRLQQDPQMADPVTGVRAVAKTVDLMEEMGQVDFMFTDKTGTLTANEMVFARCHVADQDLGDFRRQGDELPEGASRAWQILNSLSSSSADHRDPLFAPVLNFFTCLAVCHSVQAAGGAGAASFSGTSPDEVALVQAAHQAGIAFTGRERRHGGGAFDLNVRGPHSRDRKFTVLHEFPFTSERKRMSVIVKHKRTVWCITKGADSVMEPLLDSELSPAARGSLHEFSSQGLRTLIVARKRVDHPSYTAWLADYDAARSVMDSSRGEALSEVEGRMERGLKYTGVTAVEDRLQEGVPQSIQTLKEMGIRVWVLTGDKVETAVDVARSCLLFTGETHLAYAVQAGSIKEAEDMLLKAHMELEDKADGGLVLDGQTFHFVMEHSECRRIIYDLGILSRSCICARLSPKQKQQLVQLVREQNRKAITLSIGDGANDVPMIHGAHVGVGLHGKEGTQAVQASDIAIARFSLVVPLLLCHGRRAYRRVAVFLLYYLYKNVALLMADFVWMHQDRFRGRIALPEYLSIGFNVAFSSWHVMLVLGFDHDIPDRVANSSPQLYAAGPRRELFNAPTFLKWMVFAVWHGTMSWQFSSTLVGGTDWDKESPVVFWVGSTVAFTLINIIVWLKLILVSQSPFKFSTIMPTIGAVMTYILALYVLGYTPLGRSFQPCMYGIPEQVLTNARARFALMAVTCLALGGDLAEKAGRYFLCPTALQRVQKTLAAEKDAYLDAYMDGPGDGGADPPP